MIRVEWSGVEWGVMAYPDGSDPPTVPMGGPLEGRLPQPLIILVDVCIMFAER
jgi:hypothetical protein